jgi:two-component system CheB/CheR fusion protein
MTPGENTFRHSEPAENTLTIVGIGASAGGQEALERFLGAMPPDSGLAFVIVQHLSPVHESVLAELLARHTPMPVRPAQEGMAALPNCVYIIPPNHNLAVLNGVFHLMELEKTRGLSLPIDYFFRSLAQDCQERAIGIILSGAGSDGVQGLKAIKEHGGLGLAQTPESAAYTSMPQSAINTGLVDFVLPPEQMPERLLAYINHPYVQSAEALLPPAIADAEWLPKIFVLLRERTGHDFSLYKHKTIARRIERRMALHQIERIEEYYGYLRRTPQEMQTLFRELLIGVTSFFRDPEAFAALEQALPRLFQDRSPADAIRVWVPGCATGEEAYSIAILLCEQLDKLGREFKLQIFATDLDSEVIERARLGRYPASIAADVTPGRLQRFFVQTEEGYQVAERVRGMALFAVQSVIKDPPFSHLDLVSCRNVLIYLDQALQKRVLPMFHYALNPGGLLFLGTSESPDEFPHLFKPIDRRQKLFEKIGSVSWGAMLTAPPLAWPGDRLTGSHAAPAPGGPSLRETIEKLLLTQAPTSIVVNANGEVLFVHGRTGKYLEVPPGEGVATNAFHLAREGLKMPLPYVVHKAITQQERIVYDNVPVKTNGETQNIRLVAMPLPENQVLVQFYEIEAAPPPAANGPLETSDKDARIAELERQLQAMREYLQSTIEELQASNEELKSTNEELQSANEEMVTSREELQSVNEELVTLNAEHETKIEQLTRAKNDLENTLTQVDVGIIFLDRRLCLRHFNPAATRISHLIASDVGRPFSHIVSRLKYPAMLQDAQAVFENLTPREVETESEDGQVYDAHPPVSDERELD